MRGRLLAYALTVSLFSGCTFLQAVTFRPYEGSGVPPKSLSVVLLNDDTDTNTGSAQDKQMLSWCDTPPKGGQQGFVAIAGAAIIAGATIVISWASDEMASYVDKQAKKFSSKTSVTTTEDGLFIRNPSTNFFKPSFSCIVVLSNSSASKEPDFAFAARLVPSDTKPLSYKFVPTYFRLIRSAAQTGAAGTVDIQIALSLQAVTNTGDAGKSLTVSSRDLVDATIALPGVALPDSASGAASNAVGHKATDKDPDSRLGASNETPWFPLPASADQTACTADPTCQAIVPFSLTATVTQTGTGSPDYGTAKTELTDTTKNMSDAVSKIIGAVTKAAPK